jgi:hypothetical protein
VRGAGAMRALKLLASCLGAVACGYEEPAELVRVDPGELQVVGPGTRFVSIQEMVAGAGSLWVLDAAPPFITRLSRAGEATGFGMKGQGPSELLDPRAIHGQDAVARVWDLGAGRVSSFDTLGVLVDSEPLPEEGRIYARQDIRDVSFADPFRIREAGEGIVLGHFPGPFLRTADMVTGSLRRVDSSGTVDLLRFADHVEDPERGMLEWLSIPLWDSCDEGIVLWSPASSQVRWFDLRGEEMASAVVAAPSRPVTQENIEAYLRWMGRLELGPGHEEAGLDYAVMARQVRERFAKTQPTATDIRCQPGGVAWMRLFSTSSDPLGRSRVWRRISLEGEVEDFEFPPEFDPVLFTSDGAYGVLEVDGAFQQLALWGGNALPGPVHSP